MFAFTAQDPGPWQSFVMRPDNIGLPVQIVTDKYLTEQLMFMDQYNNFIAYQNWLQVQASGQAEQTPENTPEQEIVTENGVALITQNGEYIVTT
jgi:hypothetical protein